jgi:hypothetical protein
MRAPTVIALSAVAHAALFAGLSRTALPHARVDVQPAVPTPRDPEPIEVIVLSEPAPMAGAASIEPALTELITTPRTASARAAKTAETKTNAAGAASIAASSTSAASEVGPRTDMGTGAPSTSLMHMRAHGTGLEVTSEMAARIPGTPYRPGEPTITGKLESTPGGGAVVHDAVTTMTVERDGNVTFADKPDIDLQFHLPIPDLLDVEGIRQDLGRELTTWFKDPYAATKFGSMSEVSRVWTAVPGACNSYGDLWCDDELAPQAEKDAREQERTGGSIFGGNMDISAYLQRKLVGDPYASRKLKLLDDTRDERVARGTVFRNQQLLRSAELVRRTLVQLWTREADPAKRRAVLFELWDDCDEGPGDRGRAGQRARSMILGWIGARLPRGSAGAFTDEEIRRLDAGRSSKQPFAPYPAAP